jgi:hypothetical protein
MAEKSGDPYRAACVDAAAGNAPVAAPEAAWPG